MFVIKIWTVLFGFIFLYINQSSGQTTTPQCQLTSSNGNYGFCTDQSCCNGFYINNLCAQGVCCYGLNNCTSDPNTTDDPNSSSTNIPDSSSTVSPLDCQFYSRADWKALPPRKTLANLAQVKHLIVHHTTDGSTCYDFDSCAFRIRSLQSYHQLFKKWNDIAWNFLIGGDGKIYEGTRWGKEGFHSLNWNDKSIGVAFIGNFESEEVSNSMLEAFENLINCGVSKGYIHQDFKLHGHRDVLKGTKCPGTALYNQLQAFFNFEAGPL